MTRRLTLLSGMLLGVAGCATSGPMHIYTVPSGTHGVVRDQGPGIGEVAEMSLFLGPDEKLTGFTYDPYTDHFLLRLSPGNRIRVVDRPARAIKREFTIPGVPESGGGDLAVRPRDGHLFVAHPSAPALLETTRFGELLRTIPIEGTTQPPSGVAVDTALGRLAVLHADGRTITFHDHDGRQLSALQLDSAVAGSLAFDPDRRESYAPLRDDTGTIAVFDENGRLLRKIGPPARFVDVGPRSLIRIF